MVTLPDVGSVYTGGTKREFRWWIDYNPNAMKYDFYVTRTDFEMIPLTEPAFQNLREDPGHPGYSTSWSATKTYALRDDGGWIELERKEGFLVQPYPCHSMTAELIHVLAGAGVPIDPQVIADDMATFMKRLLDGLGHVLDPAEIGIDP